METPNAFVRLDSTVRDRLREFCEAKGLVMGRFVSNIITAHLDAEKAPKTKPAKPSRRRPAAKVQRKKKPAAKKLAAKKPAKKPKKKARRRRPLPVPTITKVPAEGLE